MQRQPVNLLRNDGFLRRPAAALSIVALLLQSTAPVYAQITVDRTASAGNRPALDQAANGTPIVNIVAPNAGGLSHNKFSDFNVGVGGVVLNNGASLSTSQIAGLILANPNLRAGSEASLILNEVTGTNRSALAGYLEVSGRAAAVVVANPNGITCGGCGFVNTPRATLTTGVPILDATTGALKSFSVEGGDITVEAPGLDATRVDQFDIVTRAIHLNGAVQARNLQISGGRQDYAYAGGVGSAKPDAGAPPLQFFLDSTALGGMYADRIRIVGTEHGLGIHAPDNMAASAGDMEILADGRLVFKNASSSGAIVATSRSDGIDVTGSVYADGRLSLTAASAITIADGAIAGTLGTLDLAGNTLSLGSGVIAAGLKSDGTLSAGTGSATLAFAGAVQIVSGGLLHGGDTLFVNAGSLVSAGSLQSNSSLSVMSHGLLANDGRIVSTGSATLRAADFDNRATGSIAVAGDLSIASSASLLSSGSLRADGALAMSSPVVTTADMIVGGNAQLAGGTFTETGLLNVGANASLAFTDGIVTASGAAIQAVGNLTATASQIDNGGSVVANGTVALAGTQAGGPGGALGNRASGTIAAGTALTVDGATIDNQGSMASNADLSLRFATLTNAKTVSAAGNLVLNGDTVTNAGIASGKTLQTTITHTLTNQAGATLQGTDAASVTADSIVNAGQVASGGTLAVATNLLTNDGGHIDAQSDLSIQGVAAGSPVGSISNIGGELGSVAGNLTLSGQTLVSSGTIAAGKDLTITTTDQTRNQTGGHIDAGQNVIVSAGNTLSGSGAYRANGDITLSALDVTTADVAAGGDARLTGATYHNAGTLATAGSASFDYTVSFANPAGFIIDAGTDIAIASPTMVNDGTITAQATIALQGTGDLMIDGVNADALNNDAGGRIAAGSLLLVDVANLTNAGTMTSAGDLVLQGSSFDNHTEVTAARSASLDFDQIANDGTISADTLVATSGDFTNEATGVIQATTGLDAAAVQFTNLGLLASGGALVIRADTLVNDRALIIAKGNVSLQGYPFFDGFEGQGDEDLEAGATPRATLIRNLSGIVESTEGNIDIHADTFENMGDGTAARQTSEIRHEFLHSPPPSFLPYLPRYISAAGYSQLFDGGRTQEYVFVPSPEEVDRILAETGLTINQWTPTTWQQYAPTSAADFDPTKWVIYVPDEARHAPLGSYLYARAERDVITKANTPGQVLTDHGDIAIDAGLLHNKQSTISAVGNVVLTGDSVINEGVSLARNYSIGLSYSNDTVRGEGWPTGNDGQTLWFLRGNPGPMLVRSDIVGSIPSTITATGTIAGNLAGSFVNVGSPATDPSTLSFATTSTTIVTQGSPVSALLLTRNGVTTTGTTPAAVSAKSPAAVATDARIASSQLKAFAPAADTSHFVIETRLAFIDVSSFYGSEYFFSRLGLRPDDTLRVLGDAYFDTTVVREQILDLTGKRFLDPAIDTDREQMRALIDNGVAESKRLNLALGIGLTPEQQAQLIKDVVIYVETTFRNQKVLVPQLYLSSASRATLGDKAARVSARTFDLAALVFLNDNGSIAGSDALLVQAGNIESAGGTFTGGQIILRAQSGIDLSRVTTTNGNADRVGTVIGAATQLRGETITLSAPVVTLQGINAVANRDLNINARGLTITPAEAAARNALTDTKGGYDTSQNLLLLSNLEAGGSINIAAADTAFIRAATLKAGENVMIHAGQVFIGSGQEQSASSGTFVKHGFTSGTTQWDYLTVTQIPSIVEAGKTIDITATVGDTIISASLLKAGEIGIGAQGQVRIESATDESHRRDMRTGSNLVWQSSHDSGEDQTTIIQTQLDAPKVDIDGADGVIVDVKQSIATNKALTLQFRKTNDLDQSIADLAQFQAFAYLAALKERKDVKFNLVKDEYKSWDHSQAGLSGPAATIIMLAIAVATGQPELVGTTFAGSSIAAFAVNAGFAALVSQAERSFLTTGGDIGATLKALGSNEGLRGLATAIVTTGVLQGIDQYTLLDGTVLEPVKLDAETASFGQKTLERVKSGLVESAVKSLIDTSINGGSFPKNVADSVKYAIVSEIGAAAANAIAESSPNTVVSLIAHTALGCAYGAASSGDCRSGAIGASIGEGVALGYEQITANQLAVEIDEFGKIDGTSAEIRAAIDSRVAQWRARGVDISRLAAGIAAFSAKADIRIAIDAGRNSAENNALFLLVPVALLALEIVDKALLARDINRLADTLEAYSKAIEAGDTDLAQTLKSDADAQQKDIGIYFAIDAVTFGGTVSIIKLVKWLRASKSAETAIRSAESTFSYGVKINKQLFKRGWNNEIIDSTIASPYATSSALNKATGRHATAFFNKDGSYVVRDNKTFEIIQVSNRNDPQWVPDPTIINPYVRK